jgi:putative cell wall-binding protein
VYPNGSLQNAALPAGAAYSDTTYPLAAASATTGVRALEVTDPRSGEDYFVEYRSGTGIDAPAFYASGGLEWMGLGIGVRVLQARAGSESVVLKPVAVPAGSTRQLYLRQSETLKTRSGGVTFSIAQVAGSAAQVRVQLAAAGVTLPKPPAIHVTRLSGLDRYATAVSVSKAGYPTTAPVVYVATGSDYPDALAAAPAAAKQGGPLLLTTSSTLPAAVADEIKRLKPRTIVVVGGPGVVSPAVVSRLKTLVPGTIRLAGANRFETAAKVVRYAFPHADTAYVATGMNYPDALSASAAAGSIGAPVVLVKGTLPSLDATTKRLLGDLHVTSTVIAGSHAVVSSGIESSLRSLSQVKRFGGADRFETSQLINRYAFPAITRVYLATGSQFPDALSGAALAAQKHAPLYVVRPQCIPSGSLTDIKAAGATDITLIGSEGALSAAVFAGTRC